MRLLHAGVDTSVIALWLGHESADTTQIYLHADLHRRKHSPEPNRPTPASTATSHPTACSPGSKRFDYADLTATDSLPCKESTAHIGIIRTSA